MTAAKRRSQESRILWLLQSAWPEWVPSPALAGVSLQYGARIFSLRRKGWKIVNRTRLADGGRCGEFRLGSTSLPTSRGLRKVAVLPLPVEIKTSTVVSPKVPLFDITERHRDDG
jgi:hypothetical protein